MKTINISSALLSLCMEIKENYEYFNTKTNEEVRKLNMICFRQSTEIGKYEEGIKTSSTTTETFFKEEIIWYDFKKYVDRISIQMPILKECIDLLEIEYKIDRFQVEKSVSIFIKYLFDSNITLMDDDCVIKCIELFVNDIKGCPFDWNCKIWINGLWVKKSEYRINENLLIRRPSNSDLIFENQYLYLNDDLEAKNCSAIIEYKLFDKYIKEVCSFKRKLCIVLQLFRTASVNSLKLEYTPSSILSHTNTPIGAKNIFPIYKYELNDENYSRLNIFLEVFLDLIPEEDLMNVSPINIALERYLNALYVCDLHNRITITISALEALFLKGSERMELSHKLSQRISFLLGLYKFPPLEVYSKIKKAYDIRSTYIHGSIIKNKENEMKNNTNMSDEIINYTRICLQIFLLVSNSKKKDNFIDEIDNSILDYNIASEFCRFIKEINHIEV